MITRLIRNVSHRLPTRCFVSHAYSDTEACQQLLRALPEHVQPVVFEPIVVPPDEFVSTPLVSVLLECDGLVHLTTPASQRSFWVAFERDFALAAGKRVFAFDASTRRFRPVRDRPPPLTLYVGYAWEDMTVLRRLHEILSTRGFSVWLDWQDLPPTAKWQREIEEAIDSSQQSGYAVFFWSNAAARSDVVQTELAAARARAPDRVMLALLDETPLPTELADTQAVQLYGDKRRPFAHRVDDFIVMTYWLVAERRHTEE